MDDSYREGETKKGDRLDRQTGRQAVAGLSTSENTESQA